MTKTNVTLYASRRRASIAMITLAVVGCLCATAAYAQVSTQGAFTVLDDQSSPDSVDFVNAQVMALPNNPVPSDQTQSLIQAVTSPGVLGVPGSSVGFEGDGVESPLFLGTPAPSANEFTIQPDFGTTNHPFTTARADLYTAATNKQFPYSPAGKLFFNSGKSSYICSASLIKRGIVVTAAHCVANYGRRQFYRNWRFVPGYRNGAAPFGVWSVRQAWILTSYYNGTDGCAVYGVVCPDDVAILVLNTQGGGYAGTHTGWLGYGWNGWGFTSNHLTEITQLGYPAGLDNAVLMERNDSYGYVSSPNSNNTVIGSNMNGGSSGGPWVVNFGIKPTLTGETNGFAPNPDIVVGVTSWGYTSTAPKEQGASPFTSGNIVPLVNAACGGTPSACS